MSGRGVSNKHSSLFLTRPCSPGNPPPPRRQLQRRALPRRRTLKSRPRSRPSSSRSPPRAPSCPSSKRSVSAREPAYVTAAHPRPSPPAQAPSRYLPTRRRSCPSPYPSSGKTRTLVSSQRVRPSRSSCDPSLPPFTRSTPSWPTDAARRTTRRETSNGQCICSTWYHYTSFIRTPTRRHPTSH